jgi:hypothetical protein
VEISAHSKIALLTASHLHDERRLLHTNARDTFACRWAGSALRKEPTKALICVSAAPFLMGIISSRSTGPVLAQRAWPL